jgi:putative methyltransferase (TIGR04325 family)
MKQETLRHLKKFVPPIILDFYRSLKSERLFSGDYATWDEASKLSGGYDSGLILNRVREAVLKVKRGDAVYERDSVVFDKIEYSWPLLAGLLWVASRNGNRLNLLDFGGSLGSSYFQNRHFLNHLKELRWNIVEQPGFVECGKHHFEDEHLKFYCRLDECLANAHPDTLILSSVLPYLENPYLFLEDVMKRGFLHIIIDRTPFLADPNDRLTVQKVPAEIYPASYPAWFFSELKFRNFMAANYDLLAEFEGQDYADIESKYKGFIFKCKNI